jgi:hypothetical protein
VSARSGITLGLVNLTNLKPAGKGGPIRRSLRRYLSRCVRLWLTLLTAVDGQECYMRWPGERMPPPRQDPGPGRDVRSDDWELAA